MGTWSLIIDLLRGVLFSVAHLFGGSLGSSILVVSAIIRVALLPITIKAARRALEHGERMKKLEPLLVELRKRHADDPARLVKETQATYQQHGMTMMPPGTLRSLLIQLPINAALYQAVVKGLGRGASFIWIGDLARPDMLVSAGAATLAGAIAAATPGSSGSRTAVAISVGITLILTWRLAAGVGLYWVASNAVGFGQAVWIRRSGK